MAQTKTKYIAVRVEPSLLNLLKVVARREERTLASIIRIALKDYAVSNGGPRS